MAKTPKKQSARKPATKRKAPAKSQTAPKPKFDTEAFVFEMPIEEIEKALQRLEEQEADPMAEPLSKNQIYWWGIWTMQLPEAKRRGMTHVPTCAIENAVLGLPKIGGKKK